MTAKRAARPKENPEYAGFIRRAVRAYGKRAVERKDIDAAADMVRIYDELYAEISTVINDLHSTGYSWAEIARHLGTTRQGAQQRWGN